jgi:hypothetical protein
VEGLTVTRLLQAVSPGSTAVVASADQPNRAPQ